MSTPNKKLFNQLEKLGRTRLSSNFFMREFLYSEISQAENIPNLPHHPDIAISNGTRLCEEILEPIQNSLGRISIRSGYRSPEINTTAQAMPKIIARTYGITPTHKVFTVLLRALSHALT